MAVMPGPRTRPTVQSLATMNKRNLQQWELRLGLVQLVILLGVVTGSMACAFYIGFSSGRSVGFESALERSLANAARLPIGAENAANHEEATSDVYAKLSQPAVLEGEGKDASGKEIEVPLGSIKTADADTAEKDLAAWHDDAAAGASAKSGALGVDSVYRSGESAAAKNTKLAMNQLEAEQSSTRAAEGKKTLGSLVESKSQTEAKKTEIEKSNPLNTTSTTSAKSTSEAAKLLPPTKVETAKAVEKQTAKAPVKEKNSALVREVLPSGWFAQIAAPRKMQDANALAGKLKASGFPVMIEVARVRGDEYYRVLVGPESNRARAERLVGQLKRESYIQSDPFLRVVK